MKQFARDNGLVLTLLAMFAISLIGQAVSGWHAYSEELSQHRQPALLFGQYLTSGHFLSALFENWESEFLQMAAYVLLTVFLFQKGSPESRKIDEHNPQDDIPASASRKRSSPWPVRKGGLYLWVYSHSLGIALGLLFLGSFLGHLYASNRLANDEAVRHGGPLHAVGDTLGSAEFWFESFQNWQSEFLSVAVLLLLSIYLREKGSPESKPVMAPHAETGH